MLVRLPMAMPRPALAVSIWKGIEVEHAGPEIRRAGMSVTSPTAGPYIAQALIVCAVEMPGYTSVCVQR